MKFSIFYFSGTGNTKWAVEEFCRMAFELGHQAEMLSIEDNSLLDNIIIKNILHSPGITGFAYPIIGADMPLIMKRFLDSLRPMMEKESSKPSFVLTTAGFVNGFGPYTAGKILKITGFNNSAGR